MLEQLRSCKDSAIQHLTYAKNHPSYTLSRLCKLTAGVALCAIGGKLAYGVRPEVQDIVLKCVNSVSMQRSEGVLYASTAAASTLILGLYIAKQAFNSYKPELPPRSPSR